MSIGDLFWLFFMFSAIQPILRQRMLEAMRVRKISQIESQRNSRVILLVHRQETMRLLGFPVARYIDINDSEEVLRAIQMTDEDVPLDLVPTDYVVAGMILAMGELIEGTAAPVYQFGASDVNPCTAQRFGELVEVHIRLGERLRLLDTFFHA